jgi:hypothetical protein
LCRAQGTVRSAECGRARGEGVGRAEDREEEEGGGAFGSEPPSSRTAGLSSSAALFATSLPVRPCNERRARRKARLRINCSGGGLRFGVWECASREAHTPVCALLCTGGESLR